MFLAVVSVPGFSASSVCFVVEAKTSRHSDDPLTVCQQEWNVS